STKELCTRLVVRRPDGTVVGLNIIINKHISSAFATKAVACLQVTQMGVDLGLQRVEIEGDALTIIKKTNINKRDESVISNCIEDINKLKEAFHTYCFSYTARERNGLAHILATEGLERKEQIYLLREVLSFARRKMEQERILISR
ncbi:hypothetical protein Goklo_010214, partial [Gossypium klotzschianum]|nr:hypothetical protein [Gossypium klotzschianum]